MWSCKDLNRKTLLILRLFLAFVSLFYVTERGTYAQTSEFGPPVSFNAYRLFGDTSVYHPGEVFIYDFNRDGLADILTHHDQGVVIYFNGENPGEAYLYDYNLGNVVSYRFMAIGNFIEDSPGIDLAHLDGDYGENIITYAAEDDALSGYCPGCQFGFTENSPRSYAYLPIFSYDYHPIDTETLDFNRDGHLDIALAIGDQIFLYAGDGHGYFAEPQTISLGSVPTAMEVGDFNNDGHLDLVTSNGSANSISILLSTPTAPYFANPITVAVGAGPQAVATADFNGDGKCDIVTANSGDVTVSLSTPTSARQTNTIGAGGSNPVGVAVGDMNLDGKQDFVVANRGSHTVSVYLGNESGGFSSPITTALPQTGIDMYHIFQGNITGITVGDLTNDGKPDLAFWGTPYSILTLTNTGIYQTASTPVGTGVPVQTYGATLTFDNVQTAGTTTAAPIDPATAGDIPGGFAVSNLAYDVTTTAAFSGSVTSCFTVSGVDVEADFLNLRVLHNEGGTLVDRTSSHDFANRKVCATTTSFSPFYLAKVGNNAEYLFDRTKAFKSGSTIPVKVRIRNVAGLNISSSSLPLHMRSLQKIGSNTTSAVNDPGESNPDYEFRYTTDQYQYNLKTTGLSAGRYVLTFYDGSDSSFFYTMVLEIR